MKKFTIIFVGFFCVMTFLNAQNTDTKTYFDDRFVGALADDGDFLWAGVDSLLVKLDKVSGATIATYTIPISIQYDDKDRHASSISLDSNGLAWVTCIGPVPYLETFNDDTGWTEIPIPTSFLSGLIIDENDVVWVSTILGLHKYDGSGWIDYNSLTNVELPYSSFTALALDSQNNKWLGLTLGFSQAPILLTKFNGTLFNVYVSTCLDGIGGTIGSIGISPPNTVWMGTHGNGLVKFDGIHWEVYNTSNSELPSNSVQNVTAEGANIVWMSTVNGLTRFDGETWTTFNTDNSNLPSNTITSILIDNNKTKWIGTDLGLISFAGNALSSSDEPNFGKEFKLFPNPAKDFITLKMPTQSNGSTIEIYNILGNNIKSLKMTNDTFKIDISDLANGIYLIRLRTDNGIAIKKFVKQN